MVPLNPSHTECTELLRRGSCSAGFVEFLMENAQSLNLIAFFGCGFCFVSFFFFCFDSFVFGIFVSFFVCFLFLIISVPFTLKQNDLLETTYGFLYIRYKMWLITSEDKGYTISTVWEHK